MKYWIYRNPVLAMLIPFLAGSAVVVGLVYYQILSLPWAVMLLAFVFFMVTRPVRRAYSMIAAEATYRLQNECDAQAYLAMVEKLRARKHMPRDLFFNTEALYALGLQAVGRTGEAVALMRRLLAQRESLPPALRFQFDLSYAAICAHDEEEKRELPALLAMLEHGYHTISWAPPMRELIRRNLDSLQDVMHYHSGQYEGLVERLVARIEAYRPIASMRRHMLLACLWLARVYEALNRPGDALAMYRYVAKHGNTLGIVDEAREAADRLAG